MIVSIGKMKKISYFAIIFGIMTIFSGGQNLFNSEVIKTQGNVIPEILWFNFSAGFVYLLIATLVLMQKKIALRITATLSALNFVALLHLINHVSQNGAYEVKTIFAMSFRTIFWFAFLIALSRIELFQKECNCR